MKKKARIRLVLEPVKAYVIQIFSDGSWDMCAMFPFARHELQTQDKPKRWIPATIVPKIFQLINWGYDIEWQILTE